MNVPAMLVSLSLFLLLVVSFTLSIASESVWWRRTKAEGAGDGRREARGEARKNDYHVGLGRFLYWLGWRAESADRRRENRNAKRLARRNRRR